MNKSTPFKSFLLFILIFAGYQSTAVAQEQTEEDRLSYYEQRGREDAAYEQTLNTKEEADEADFWEDQEAYEKELKSRDSKAHRAYMRGKRDAYKEHYAHCDHHCHHGSHYYSHASFYYHGYYRSYDRPSRTRINTGVRIGTPSVRIGL
ncbi:hypothetical protein [Zeaxanthinibacter enoshimensis]|uniref:Uncharacterized protein n=1 Tax=Zeaxanthinibacter enoshimensis TaxID=392009 RepID=A0A4R6TMT5_9FLAO|nr:hypothetical protein [Zeaxanthinibacter enoshimensis]TDQ32535.1 hypothetical protein CLV82_0364 [Zeaxanthinibacter enoshimensis]